ncbi:MAG: hypothetical protein ACI9HU_001216, partial [Colwellia sp.]
SFNTNSLAAKTSINCITLLYFLAVPKKAY